MTAANLSRYTFCSFIAKEMNVRRKVKTPEDNHVCAPGIEALKITVQI